MNYLKSSQAARFSNPIGVIIGLALFVGGPIVCDGFYHFLMTVVGGFILGRSI